MCSDPCDGRTQGTAGMFDSLPYRNDAAITMRRLIRSLPRRAGVMGIATCDKGLPATMLALAGCGDLPGIIVPGGVTLPAIDGEDAGKVQSIGARFAHGLITRGRGGDDGVPRLRHAGRRLPVPGHGRDVAGGGRGVRDDAAAQRAGPVGRAGLARHGAPFGAARWCGSSETRMPLSAILTQDALENAMLLHAAFGGSTNLLLHIPALAHAAGLRRPTVDDWHAHQPHDAAAGRRAAQRPAQSSDGAGVHGGRRARGDAAPARAWACSTSTS